METREGERDSGVTESGRRTTSDEIRLIDYQQVKHNVVSDKSRDPHITIQQKGG